MWHIMSSSKSKVRLCVCMCVFVCMCVCVYVCVCVCVSKREREREKRRTRQKWREWGELRPMCHVSVRLSDFVYSSVRTGSSVSWLNWTAAHYLICTTQTYMHWYTHMWQVQIHQPTHTHTRVHIYPHAHVHTHICTHIHTPRHTRVRTHNTSKHTQTHAPSLSLTHTRTRTHTHTRTLSFFSFLSLSLSLACARTHTHTHTHTGMDGTTALNLLSFTGTHSMGDRVHRSRGLEGGGGALQLHNVYIYTDFFCSFTVSTYILILLIYIKFKQLDCAWTLLVIVGLLLICIMKSLELSGSLWYTAPHFEMELNDQAKNWIPADWNAVVVQHGKDP